MYLPYKKKYSLLRIVCPGFTLKSCIKIYIEYSAYYFVVMERNNFYETLFFWYVFGMYIYASIDMVVLVLE